MKSITVNISRVKADNRYEPEYWILTEELSELLAQHPHHSLDYYASSIKKGIFDMKAKYYQSSGVPFLRISNLKFFELDKTGMVFIPQSEHDKNLKTELREGDIAFSKIGTLGKMLRVGKEYPIVNISQNLIGLRVNDLIDKNYVFAFLLSKFALYQIIKNRKQQLQDKLNLDDLKRLEICRLSLDDEKDLSLMVDEISNLTYEANVLINNAKKVLSSALGLEDFKVNPSFSFTANLSSFVKADLWSPKYSHPLYVETLSFIRSHCQTVALGNLVTLYKGDEVGSDNYIDYLDKRSNDVPFVRTSDIVNNEIDHFPDYFVPCETYDDISQNLQTGDILFTKDGKIGVVGMITECDKAIVSSGVAILRVNPDNTYGVTPEYIFTALSIKEIGAYGAARRTVVATTIPHLRDERLLDIDIPIPSKEIIEQITLLVSEAFKYKNTKKEMFKALRNKIDEFFPV